MVNFKTVLSMYREVKLCVKHMDSVSDLFESDVDLFLFF